MTPKRCAQVLQDNEQCPCLASYRFTWPGRPESFICGECEPKLRKVAQAMGLPLQIIDLHSEAT
jgi:hypothetical protein